MPRKIKEASKKANAIAYGRGSRPSRSDTATDDSGDRGHEGGLDGMGVRARTDSSAPTPERRLDTPVIQGLEGSELTRS